jgi:uncharacterized protein YjiS (DUF1127 family)
MITNQTEVARLRAEIRRLDDEQIADLKRATFLGMTQEQASDYETKRRALAELRRKLISLIGAVEEGR